MEDFDLIKKYNEISAYLKKSKLIYTGIFFFFYLAYRFFSCRLLNYGCYEELASLIPFIIVGIYYAIGIVVLENFMKKWLLKNPDNFIRNALYLDYFFEILFYCTTFNLIDSESENPYLTYRVLIITGFDFLFMLFIFRDIRSFKNKINRLNVIGPSFFGYFFITLFSVIFYFFTIIFLKELYRFLMSGKL